MIADQSAQEQQKDSSVEDDALETVNPFARIWRAYNRVLHDQPILVKSATSFFGFLAGDVLAQTIVGNPFNYWRTVRLVLFGMFMDGPVGMSSCCLTFKCSMCLSCRADALT